MRFTPPIRFGGPATASDGQGGWTRYTKPRFGFTIAVPPGFHAGPSPANDDGRVFRRAGAEVRVFGSNNAPAESFDEKIERASRNLIDVRGARTGPTDWRGTGADRSGRPVAIRLLRPHPDHLVTATFAGPVSSDIAAETVSRTLESLRLSG